MLAQHGCRPKQDRDKGLSLDEFQRYVIRRTDRHMTLKLAAKSKPKTEAKRASAFPVENPSPLRGSNLLYFWEAFEAENTQIRGVVGGFILT